LWSTTFSQSAFRSFPASFSTAPHIGSLPASTHSKKGNQERKAELELVPAALAGVWRLGLRCNLRAQGWHLLH
jgi:hypothetical protein